MIYLQSNKQNKKHLAWLLTIVLALVSLYSCAPRAYKNLQAEKGDATCLQKFVPNFKRALYQTTVDVAGNHLSGILLIKEMPDTSLRVVFSNEAGVKFFDFEFSKNGAFQVYSIIEKMNKESVKKTLRKDFQLIFMNMPINRLSPYRFNGLKGDEKYFAYHESKDFYYYIININCSKLLRMERGSRTRKVLEAYMGELKNGVPDSIQIHHTNFNFDINLKQIYDNAE